MAAAGCGRGPADYTAGGKAMGTVVSARAIAPDEETARRAAEAALAALAEAEDIASYYDPDSELSRVNREAGERPVPISPDLFELLELARETAEASGGYFDPTVAPVIAAYGIKDKAPRWPDDEELAGVMEGVGYEGIILDAGNMTVAYAHPAMVVDLSGIAKGWAVDRARAAMEAAGATAGIVEAGGEVACFGGGPGAEEAWRVGVKHPAGEGLYGTFELGEGACATSGGYEQKYEADGHKFSHLFDPTTGRPAATGPAGVTVTAATCAEADAWATALAVIPAAEAGRMIKRAEGPGSLILKEDGKKIIPEICGNFPEIKELSGRE
ncbi:MAG: FAD:protein FMN transferase [Candidatus Zixiibacteriota bacterium]